MSREFPVMGFNFRECDRDQVYMLPPSVADWLEPDHLAWFMLDVVEQMDLAAFYAAYRRDGRGGAAFDPSMMVALLLYSYAIGERSTRRIEQRCKVDVAYRVIAANQQPDHSTISRFRQQHEARLELLFVESVRLCHEAGLGNPRTVAVDGRKVEADAAGAQNRNLDQIERDVQRWFEESAAIDAHEDELYGVGKRGDELPPELRDRKTRRARIAEAKAKLDREKAAADEAKVDRAEREREHLERTGHKLSGRKPKDKDLSRVRVNLTDPDSRILKVPGGFVQGYNSQAVVTEDQIVIGAEVVDAANDLGQLHPMIAATEQTLHDAGISTPIGRVLADAGYCVEQDLLDAEQDPDAPKLYVATRARSATKTRRASPAIARMTRRLRNHRARAIYNLRGQTVEAVFGQHVTVQGFHRYSRRGIEAVASEWKLQNAAHNLIKLWRHRNTTLKLA